MRRLLVCSCLVLSVLLPAPALAQGAPGCTFVLGFATLHALVRTIVGACVDNEQHNPANGDALQRTTNGLLVWRKADNFTAFTDGYHSWVNGPYGVQERLNTQRFPWEANPDKLPVVGAVTAIGADWPTYGRAQARTSVAPGPAATTLAPLWQSGELDGAVYAEPLVVGDNVLVATEANSVYAFDAASGAVRWRRHLGEPVPGGALPCGDIDPVGITGTPVVDAGSGTLYAAGFVAPGQYVLWALDIASGAVRWQRAIAPAGFAANFQGQRSALALANGMVYVAFGGRDYDCGTYHGVVVGTPASGSGDQVVYQTPTATGGAIWAPSGIAVDGTGNLYVATGNGGSGAYDASDSVLKLSPGLGLLASFAPANWRTLSADDLDLGSVGPTLLNDQGLIFQIGKEGVGYLLRQDGLGGIGGQAYAGRVCDVSTAAAFGGAAYAAPYLYVPCRDGVVALQVGGGAFRRLWYAPAASGAPVVAGGVVWSISRGGTLVGLDPATGDVRFSRFLGAPITSFPNLAASGGRLYAPAGRRIVALATS